MCEPAEREFRSINPATGEVIGSWEPHSDERVSADLDRAVAAFAGWRDRGVTGRAVVLRAVAQQLTRDRDRLAALATREMGKPLAQSLAEVDKCAFSCRYVAEQAAGFLADVVAPSNATESYVAFRPLGLVLAIMPWNFPYWQVFRFASSALMAGNVGYLKHAENVSGVALEIQEVFERAGAPAGVFTTGLVRTPRIAGIIGDSRVAAVTLTGSTRAGRSVAAAAGQSLKKSVLELGGSDAFIVLADADLEAAARTAVASRFQNAGQSCIAAKRFIVEQPVLARFTDLLVAKARELTLGDPAGENVTMGPMAREDLRDTVAEQVRDSVAAGATVLTGGAVPERAGWFYPPTVLAGVTPDMRVMREEVFGPVAAVIGVPDAQAAIELANATEYGLGGNLWTADVDRGKKLAAEVITGQMFVNGMTASDPRLPFGGVKSSGYGREQAAFGIREFVNVQTVWVGPPTELAAGAPVE